MSNTQFNRPFIVLSFKEWLDKYDCLTNYPLDLDINQEYVEDGKTICVRDALENNSHTVWTQVAVGDNLYIVNRLAFVDRLAYYITREPYDPSVDIEVLEWESNEEDQD